MGGNIYSTREEIQSLEPVPFDNYEKNKGANGFRLVISAPQNPSKQYLLAQYYNQDNLVRKSTENYSKWLQLAADGGNASAMARLAAEYYYLYTEEGYKKCYELCVRAAESEQHYALLQLAKLYSNGYYVQKDMKKAFEYYERSANAGNLTAMNKMAVSYRDGDELPVDKEKYFYWMEKAVNGGLDDESLAIELAQCYQKGQYCEKDEKKAFELFCKLAEKEGASILALVARRRSKRTL